MEYGALGRPGQKVDLLPGNYIGTTRTDQPVHEPAELERLLPPGVEGRQSAPSDKIDITSLQTEFRSELQKIQRTVAPYMNTDEDKTVAKFMPSK